MPRYNNKFIPTSTICDHMQRSQALLTIFAHALISRRSMRARAWQMLPPAQLQLWYPCRLQGHV